jgi:hypothetical protein
MEEKKEFHKPRSLFFPLLFVAAGVFLLLVNLGTLKDSAWDILSTWWPLIFIIGGLDGLYKRDGWVGPLVALGLGTILILGNLGYLKWDGLNLLWRMWPILLVAWGLDVAFGHQKSVWSTLGRIALGLLLIGGILWLAIASPFNNALRSESVSQSLDSALRSEINFSTGVGEFTLAGNAPEDKLVAGTVRLPENLTLSPSYTAPVDGTSTYSLESAGVVVLPVNTEDTPWTFKINSSIPVELDTELAVGNLVLDLSGTAVESVDSKLAVGQSYITFPAGVDVQGDIETAVGDTVLRFPKGTNVVIHYSGGLSSVSLADGFSRNDDEIRSDFTGDNTIELSVDQAVGSLSIEWYE